MTEIEEIESLLTDRQTGWWENICNLIPELKVLDKTPQPQEFHAEGNVGIHTRLAIEACPSNCDIDLLWIALLHDIGKPDTTKQSQDGAITAYGHAKLGAEIAGKILGRISMPEYRRDRIIWVIHHHNFHHSWQLHNVENLSKRQRRYLENPNFPLLLEFLRIDSIASQGNPRGMETYFFYKALWESLLC